MCVHWQHTTLRASGWWWSRLLVTAMLLRRPPSSSVVLFNACLCRMFGVVAFSTQWLVPFARVASETFYSHDSACEKPYAAAQLRCADVPHHDTTCPVQADDRRPGRQSTSTTYTERTSNDNNTNGRLLWKTEAAKQRLVLHRTAAALRLTLRLCRTAGSTFN